MHRNLSLMRQPIPLSTRSDSIRIPFGAQFCFNLPGGSRRPAWTARTLSQHLRDRVVAAIDGGMSCRAAAAHFGVSASSAIRWRRLALKHGQSVARPRGGDRDLSKIEVHSDFIKELIAEQGGYHLGRGPGAADRAWALRLESAQCIASSHGTASRAKKDRARDRARLSRRPEATIALVRWPTRARY